ncbi:hypothetical protein QO010_002776 [Caulobacter ginsengisoli]|uniref:Lipoprotein n=1 Tax=Caulobacter ginsengisoli TaxID=400775 RepID=A0ABU0ISL1_9CAUL|nr:hypothetical protein [Caulobacter ginsengisoli]MDQ0464992.1 hypothetical protein [Caulobacter ginsengisoli]
MSRYLAAAAAVGLLAAATPALAVTVRDCDGRTEAAYNIVEPWETSSKTFYQGQVRVAYLDTGGEPACCSAHLLVLFFNQDEPGGGMTCRLVSAEGDNGFAGIDFKSLKSSYDPARGLLLSFNYRVFPPGGDGSTLNRGVARVRVNVAGGAVTAE